jgi:hypothetical protein
MLLNQCCRYGTIPSDSAGSSPSIVGNCTLLPLIAPVQRSTLKQNLVHLSYKSISTYRLNFYQCCGTVTIFYGSSSDFWKVMVPVPTFEKVMVPVSTFENLRFRFRFRFQLHIYTIKSKFFLRNLFPFYILSCQCCESGSGIRDWVPFWPLDPGSGMGESQHQDPGSGMNNPDHIF